MSLQDYIFEKPVIETEHLILRTMNKSDIDDLKEWISDISLYEYWGKRPSKSEKNPELLFDKSKKSTKSFHWGIVHKQDSKVIGEIWIYLIENNRIAKVAFRLSKQYQKIWTDVHILNHASYKTLEKVGFQREGHIREGKMVNTYCDYYLYGILKSDYSTS